MRKLLIAAGLAALAAAFVLTVHASRAGAVRGQQPLLNSDSLNITSDQLCGSFTPIVATALNGSQKIVAGVAGEKTYVCSFFVVSSAAVSVNFVEGTKTTTDCDTNPANVTGPAPLAINGQLAMPGTLTLPFMATAGDDLCIKTSGAATLGGWIAYWQR